MSLFGKSKVTYESDIEEYKVKAEGAINVFRQSYNDLLEVNKGIKASVEQRMARIADLQTENKELGVMLKDNMAAAKKIGSIFGKDEKDEKDSEN